MSISEEVKSKLDIIEIISESISLKASGNNWKGICPFHAEKTPSFMVSKDKQIWHCFGCGEGGDVFAWLIKKENIDFPEALKILSQRAGVKLVHQDPQVQSRKNLLIDICSTAAEIWHKVLLTTEAGKPALEYLSRRGIQSEDIEDWKIGFAPNSYDFLLKNLLLKKYRLNDIFEAGLITLKTNKSSSDAQNYYDYFRRRIIYPVRDLHGMIVGFGGRFLDNEKDNVDAIEKLGPKYVNTKETVLYQKSKVLYGIDFAKDAIRKNDFVILVEGYMDVIASARCGVKNVVACSGTALTLDQIQLLKRYTNNITLAFDMDLAGRNANQRGIDLALNASLDIKVVILPNKFKDPDECVVFDNGKTWQAVISNRISVFDYYFILAYQNKNLNNIDDKRAIASILLPVLSKISDPILFDTYLRRLSKDLDISQNVLNETLSKFKTVLKNQAVQAVPKLKTQDTKPAVLKTRQLMSEERLLAILLKYPKYLPYTIDRLEVQTIEHNTLKELYRQLLIYYTKLDSSGVGLDGLTIDSLILWLKSEVDEKLSASLESQVNILLLLSDEKYSAFTDKEIHGEVLTLITFLKQTYIRKRLKEIEKEISIIERDNKLNSSNPQNCEALSAEYQTLSKSLNNSKTNS